MSSLTQWRGGQSQQGQLARRQDNNPLELFRRQFDALFDQFFGPPARAGESGEMRLWDFDVEETDGGMVVRAEMPGFDEKDIDVRLDDNVLTIRAEKKQEGDGQRSYRSFRRSITLPPGVNPDGVQAMYRNGVLELAIPLPQGRQGKQIPVQGGQAQNQGRQAQTGSEGGATPAGSSGKASTASKRETAAQGGKA
jgi:HSP20 family protein